MADVCANDGEVVSWKVDFVQVVCFVRQVLASGVARISPCIALGKIWLQDMLVVAGCVVWLVWMQVEQVAIEFVEEFPAGVWLQEFLSGLRARMRKEDYMLV